MEDVQEETKKFKKELDATEKRDLSAVIEHLATVGAHWQQRAARKRHAVSSKNDDQKIHVEDDITYISPEFRVKKRTVLTTTLDDTWDMLHGDSIHPIAFADAKLSKNRKRQRTVDKDTAMNGTNLAIDTTCSYIEEEDALRTLLNRCWQRAMHAVSNPIVMDEQDDAKLPASALSPNEEMSPAKDFSPDRATAKCKALGLSLALIPNDDDDDDDDDSQIRVCPSCEITAFETNKQVHRHYYGMPNQRGCCWRLIADREHDLIRRALQGEVKMVIQQIGRSIRTHSSRRMMADSPHGWKEVFSAMQNAVTVRDRTRQTTFLTSIVADSSEPPPSVIDASLMKVLQGRLLDRYADVPR
jgi:hypothetical protein